MQERLQRQKCQTQSIPNRHHPPQGTGENRQCLCLWNALQLPDGRIEEGRHSRAIAYEIRLRAGGAANWGRHVILLPESFPLESFSTCFADLDDPRADNARHDLHEILLIALCAVLCGAEDGTDMALFGRAKHDYFRSFLHLRHGIPSHDTFSRLFRLLNPAQFHACFLTFMRRFTENLGGVVALDGKTLRRSFGRAAGQSPLHLVSAWAADQRLVLGQMAVDGKSNEITAVPKLLALLSLQGTIVTADAMHCQRAVAEQVVAQGGDYVLA